MLLMPLCKQFFRMFYAYIYNSLHQFLNISAWVGAKGAKTWGRVYFLLPPPWPPTDLPSKSLAPYAVQAILRGMAGNLDQGAVPTLDA